MNDITPTIDETTETQTVDVNGNGEYDPDDGDEFDDVNGDGVFQGVWVAGYGSPRPASGVADPQWARAVALQNGETTIVMLALDCVGIFRDDVVRIREAVADLEIDYVAVSATHTHEARDTMGNWGPQPILTGVDPEYQGEMIAGAAAAIREAVATLRPANVEYTSFRLRDQPGGVLRYVSDARDPVIIDDEGRLMRFVEADTETTIATVFNLAAHAEYTGDENQLLSSDIAHYLRQVIEDGVTGPDGAEVAGVGGIALFVNGAVGSQIGPGEVEVETWDGTDLGDEYSFELAETVGTQLGYFALEALRSESVVRDDSAALGFRSFTFLLAVDNGMFELAHMLGVFPTREAEDTPEGEMGFRTEIATIDVGRAAIIAVPGELDPALLLGGYDGTYTPEGVEIVDETQTNPPDLDEAPSPPYLRDLVREEAEYTYLFGLTNDEIGYLIPPFDYELHPDDPYMDEAEGDHYEETNSIGPDAWPTIEGHFRSLFAWSPETSE